jgi:hypothetical protein
MTNKMSCLSPRIFLDSEFTTLNFTCVSPLELKFQNSPLATHIAGELFLRLWRVSDLMVQELTAPRKRLLTILHLAFIRPAIFRLVIAHMMTQTVAILIVLVANLTLELLRIQLPHHMVQDFEPFRELTVTTGTNDETLHLMHDAIVFLHVQPLVKLGERTNCALHFAELLDVLLLSVAPLIATLTLVGDGLQLLLRSCVLKGFIFLRRFFCSTTLELLSFRFAPFVILVRIRTLLFVVVISAFILITVLIVILLVRHFNGQLRLDSGQVFTIEVKVTLILIRFGLDLVHFILGRFDYQLFVWYQKIDRLNFEWVLFVLNLFDFTVEQVPILDAGPAVFANLRCVRIVGCKLKS